MAMKAGLLRWPITIEQKTNVQDPNTGEMTPTWSTFVTTRADMQPVARRGSRSAWEAVVAQQIKASSVILFDIRYIAGIDETMRVRANGKVYDIKTIINVDSRNRELWLICETGLDAG